MSTTAGPPLDSRRLCLIPTVWRQSLLSADRQHPPQEERRFSLHAKARWLGDPGWNWFDDHALSDILFEIDILSDTTASKRRGERSLEWEGTIGGVRYYDERQDSETGEKFNSFVHGMFSVSDAVFEDLWERVKFRVALPCDVWLEVLGLQIDISPSLRDHWDVKKQPKLKVLSVELRFSTEQAIFTPPYSGQSSP